MACFAITSVSAAHYTVHTLHAATQYMHVPQAIIGCSGCVEHSWLLLNGFAVPNTVTVTVNGPLDLLVLRVACAAAGEHVT